MLKNRFYKHIPSGNIYLGVEKKSGISFVNVYSGRVEELNLAEVELAKIKAITISAYKIKQLQNLKLIEEVKLEKFDNIENYDIIKFYETRTKTYVMISRKYLYQEKILKSKIIEGYKYKTPVIVLTARMSMAILDLSIAPLDYNKEELAKERYEREFRRNAIEITRI